MGSIFLVDVRSAGGIASGVFQRAWISPWLEFEKPCQKIQRQGKNHCGFAELGNRSGQRKAFRTDGFPKVINGGNTEISSTQISCLKNFVIQWKSQLTLHLVFGISTWTFWDSANSSKPVNLLMVKRAVYGIILKKLNFWICPPDGFYSPRKGW